MEFNEKLQELRKKKGLTQEELAEALFVSRTAVSKWESGRGYPNIDSLKDISAFFSVSIDNLLSGEKLLYIAENENRINIKNICNTLLGIADLFSLMLIILPLYPNTVDGFVYSVSLWNYAETATANLVVYWLTFVLLGLIGAVRIPVKPSAKVDKILTAVSMTITVFAVFYLGLAREAYAVSLVFLMLILKSVVIFKSQPKK